MLHAVKKRKVVHAVFYIMQIVKRLGVKKDKTLNVFREFPMVHLPGIQKEKRSGLYVVFDEIDFVNAASVSEKYSQVKVVFVRFMNVFMSGYEVVFYGICVEFFLFLNLFKLLYV